MVEYWITEHIVCWCVMKCDYSFALWKTQCLFEILKSVKRVLSCLKVLQDECKFQIVTFRVLKYSWRHIALLGDSMAQVRGGLYQSLIDTAQRCDGYLEMNAVKRNSSESRNEGKVVDSKHLDAQFTIGNSVSQEVAARLLPLSRLTMMWSPTFGKIFFS